MKGIYGLPQTLTGAEMVTIEQEQNGSLATCSMPLSLLVNFIASQLEASVIRTMSTTQPTTAGVVWNNNGVISIS